MLTAYVLLPMAAYLLTLAAAARRGPMSPLALGTALASGAVGAAVLATTPHTTAVPLPLIAAALALASDAWDRRDPQGG